MTVVEQIRQFRVVPVVVVQDPAQGAPLADALVAGGLPVAEITFRTPAAAGAIARMAHRDDLLVGAGTVVTADQVDAAVDAGAAFVVSPGFSAAVVRRAGIRRVPVLPGVASATEIMAALDAGLDTVKFFPAGTSGGVPGVKALSAPFPQLSFVPTGGVGPKNLGEYLSLPSVVAVGGSWMVPPDALAAGDYDAVTRLCAEAVRLAAAAR